MARIGRLYRLGRIILDKRVGRLYPLRLVAKGQGKECGRSGCKDKDRCENKA